MRDIIREGRYSNPLKGIQTRRELFGYLTQHPQYLATKRRLGRLRLVSIPGREEPFEKKNGPNKSEDKISDKKAQSNQKEKESAFFDADFDQRVYNRVMNSIKDQ
jgi:hypothetical protein